MKIRCGHCGNTHQAVDVVRACHRGAQLFDCGWLVDTREYDEDGGQIIVECGADAWQTDRGWECANGHSHVYAEVAYQEGWAYVTEDEADGYAKDTLRTPVLMNGQVWRP